MWPISPAKPADPTCTAPVDNEAPADPGPQRDHHDVTEAAGRSQAVLGQHGEVGVVLDQERATGQPGADQLVPVHALGLRQVGGEAQPAPAVDHARGTHTDRALARRRPPRWWQRVWRCEVGDHLGHGRGHVAADDGPGPGGGGDSGLGDDVVGRAERHAEDLGPADVDAVGDVGGRRIPARSHEVVDSTRAFSSRMAVAMMRLVARILMKPGMGTRSSASTW